MHAHVTQRGQQWLHSLAGHQRQARCPTCGGSQVETRTEPLTISSPAGLADEPDNETAGAIYEFEPSEEEILAELLPNNLAVQIYTALLENAASEQGARMTAMDNATRNAGDMIDRLTMNYNRTRQAVITKELIEIISGAEAL